MKPKFLNPENIPDSALPEMPSASKRQWEHNFLSVGDSVMVYDRALSSEPMAGVVYSLCDEGLVAVKFKSRSPLLFFPIQCVPVEKEEPVAQTKVPLTFDDIPPGSVIRFVGARHWLVVTNADSNGIKTRDNEYTFKQLIDMGFEIYRVGTQKWESCYKLV